MIIALAMVLEAGIFCAAGQTHKRKLEEEQEVRLHQFCPPENKKALKAAAIKALMKSDVNPLGLEPKTHTLKVYCSTN